MEFRLLGPLEVWRDGERVNLGGKRERAVLAALLLRANQVATFGYLENAVWDRPPASPETNLRTYLTGLRRRLGAGRFHTRPGGYLAEVRPGELDLAEFERLSSLGESALDRGEPAEAVIHLRAALDLWRGEPLAGESYGDALGAEVARLADRRIGTACSYARAQLDSSDAATVIDELTGLTTEFPLREELWELLIRALYRAGRQGDALAAYESAGEILSSELGIDPGAALQQLHQQVLAGDPELDNRVSGPVPPAQLPADLAGFTGRTTELDRLAELVDGHGSSAVLIAALDGMAGVGKTALATRFAHSVRARYPDGQLFLDLHAYTADTEPVEPAQALDRLLRSLGVPGDQIPADVDARAARYRTRLANRRVLIVLDNAGSERQVAPLLPGTPGSLVVITSRRSMGALDNVVPVPLDVLPAADAVDLFGTVAGPGRAEPRELVEDVVGRCGLLPLAIRIAAARLRARPSWSLERLAERLRDEQRRLGELAIGERSVAGAFALSYRDVPEDQQRMFRYLGVNPGADIDAPAAAALADCPVDEAEDLLEHLCDAHLLQQPAPGRYQFHDLLRVHAARLADDERDVALDRLLNYHVSTTEAALAVLDLEATHPRGWLETDLTNILAACTAAAASGRPEHPLRMSRLLAGYLQDRNLLEPAISLHTQARDAAVVLGDAESRFAALDRLGYAQRVSDRHEAARKTLLEAVAVAADLERPAGLATVYDGLGALERLAGRSRSALTYHERAVELAAAEGDRVALAKALTSLGVDNLALGRHKDAEEYLCRSLELAQETGSALRECWVLLDLAVLYRATGRGPEAAAAQERAMGLAGQVGHRRLQLRAALGMAEGHLADGRLPEARDAYLAVIETARRNGAAISERLGMIYLGEVYLRLGEYEQALAYQQSGLDQAVQVGEANTEYEARLALVPTLAALHRYDEALAQGEQAVRMARDLGQRHDEGRALDALAAALFEQGDRAGAREQWRQAFAIFADLGAVEAGSVAERLAELDG